MTPLFKYMQQITERVALKTYGSPVVLTLFHHANVHTAFEPACLAVAPVVLGDGATAVKGTREGGLALHTAPK